MNEILDNLYISNITDARTKNKDNFDTVITVCQDTIEDNVSCDYKHFNLADGEIDDYKRGECTYNLFKQSVDYLLSELKQDKTVLIHCHAGMSRSVTVSIAAIAVYQDISYNEAYNIVKNNRNLIQPNEILVGFAKKYIMNSDTGSVSKYDKY